MAGSPLWWIPNAPDSVKNYSSNRAPYGVVFDGPDKVYVGSPHGDNIEMSDDIKAKIRDIASKHGAWYEGDGKDIRSTKGLFDNSSPYRGSWDDLVAKGVEGYPPELLSGLFSNVDVNGQPKVFESPKQSIFDSLLSNQKQMRYIKDRDYDAETLRQFLKSGSESNQDFVSMANQPATKENLQKFFSSGEKLMWPESGWESYPNNFGKMAQKFEQLRNQQLLSQKAGVYFAGAGHLPELIKMKKGLKMIGGEKASD